MPIYNRCTTDTMTTVTTVRAMSEKRRINDVTKYRSMLKFERPRLSRRRCQFTIDKRRHKLAFTVDNYSRSLSGRRVEDANGRLPTGVDIADRDHTAA